MAYEDTATSSDNSADNDSMNNGTAHSSSSDATDNSNTSVKTDKDDSVDTDNNKDNRNKKDNNPFRNVSFINLADMASFGRPQPKLKKKKKGESKPPIDLKNIPAPHKIKEQLDQYVVGQEQAKKIVSVAVYNHYKRVCSTLADDVEIEKSNVLMIGPTGCGKTYLVKTLAKLLDVPLAIADATSLTEAGYIGDDIESVLSKLLAAADDDVERAEMGIVFIDEIDKIAKKKETNHRDVSGESVQQGLLKLLEGSEVEVPVGANSKNAMVPLTTINTKNILFICGGAFPDLDKIIKERLNQKSSMGFAADLKDKYDNDEKLLSKVTIEDIRNFGMIPEFLGRMPIVCTMDKLDIEMLKTILIQPKNAILKQYKKLLELDEVELIFDDSAIEAIAKKALERKTGARALRAILEDFMLDIMYEIPKDDNIGRVTITGDYIEGKGAPVIEMRSTPVITSSTACPETTEQ
ncbi:MAG: ATP-dependent Clp protease ATP-binding subunit ClpX [Lachnospiraceae bacterium]|nr:ATP-dependent Clp protease ATP-binding subunit ClpX [Lachnospiraceae bacterium]